ncbi:beta-lactamase family protein [Pyxidicoccus parkwayensis]|uniref:Beta-lactamase family protein n=1 Tax=Pyxidicoccus parkwayensis TaxID=2813578 RepID=A0ABX7NT84_9BACT|nr:serine hydrolase domain-containing protein [Pyxidicoccus parkwaysis]QSQ22077.1 beta-lactamase family protein [Pyxidicoccus parkwaysis]
MSSGGWSKARLGRMHDVMSRHVEEGRVPGYVSLLGRRGEVHVDVVGNKALGGGGAMQRDTLFRITSMTKPVTAVAALILVEECKLRLDDAVDRWLPELANRRVLKRLAASLDDTVPANRPITVRDVLTFRMGFGLVMPPSGALPIEKAIAEAQLSYGPPKPATQLTPDEWMRRLGELPLMHQPGERWMYNTGSHVLGVLIARASGQPLETFFRERIFEPLGMKDTHFTVPAEKLERLATSYMPNSETGALELHDGVQDSQWSRPPVFPDGAAGLVSTVDDFFAFARMLMGNGKLGSIRVLSRRTVEAMTTDQLTPEQKVASGLVPGAWGSFGWGFGVSIVTQRDGVAAVPGRYGWDGGYGTAWSNDPEEELISLLMTQRAGFPTRNPVYQDFWTLAYAAIDD